MAAPKKPGKPSGKKVVKPGTRLNAATRTAHPYADEAPITGGGVLIAGINPPKLSGGNPQSTDDYITWITRLSGGVVKDSAEFSFGVGGALICNPLFVLAAGETVKSPPFTRLYKKVLVTVGGMSLYAGVMSPVFFRLLIADSPVTDWQPIGPQQIEQQNITGNVANDVIYASYPVKLQCDFNGIEVINGFAGQISLAVRAAKGNADFFPFTFPTKSVSAP